MNGRRAAPIARLMWSSGPLPRVPRWLLRFGYDGEGYSGWARQPGLRTVEGTIREGLLRSGLVRELGPARLEVASRTDAGVSARANALALSSELPLTALLRGMNGIAADIYFTAGRRIPSDFRVRSAQWREYRYYLPGDVHRAKRLQKIAAQLPAQVDARSFGRGLPVDRPLFRDLDSLRVHFDGHGVRIDLRARSFVWGMVRKIVGGLLSCEEGRLALPMLVRAANGTTRLTLPLAPADGLLLWEVRYPTRWSLRYTRRGRGQSTHLIEARRRAETRHRVLGVLHVEGSSEKIRGDRAPRA